MYVCTAACWCWSCVCRSAVLETEAAQAENTSAAAAVSRYGSRVLQQFYSNNRDRPNRDHRDSGEQVRARACMFGEPRCFLSTWARKETAATDRAEGISGSLSRDNHGATDREPFGESKRRNGQKAWAKRTPRRHSSSRWGQEPLSPRPSLRRRRGRGCCYKNSEDGQKSFGLGRVLRPHDGPGRQKIDLSIPASPG